MNTEIAPTRDRRRNKGSHLAGIQYVGECGLTQECVGAVVQLLQCGPRIAKARLLTASGCHALVLSVVPGDVVAVKSGFGVPRRGTVRTVPGAVPPGWPRGNRSFISRADFRGDLRSSILASLRHDDDAGESELRLARSSGGSRAQVRNSLDNLELTGRVARTPDPSANSIRVSLLLEA